MILRWSSRSSCNNCGFRFSNWGLVLALVHASSQHRSAIQCFLPLDGVWGAAHHEERVVVVVLPFYLGRTLLTRLGQSKHEQRYQCEMTVFTTAARGTIEVLRNSGGQTASHALKHSFSLHSPKLLQLRANGKRGPLRGKGDHNIRISRR